MHITTIETPIGIVEIGVDHDALVSLGFVEKTKPTAVDPSGIGDALRAYFTGDLGAIDEVSVRFDRGTHFQRDVWDASERFPSARPSAMRSSPDASADPRLSDPSARRTGKTRLASSSPAIA